MTIFLDREEDDDGHRVVWFRRQFEYPHGAFMCTTACMQIGMAVLCGQVDPQGVLLGRTSKQQATERIDKFMEVADTVHGRVESILFLRSSQQQEENARQSGGGADASVRHLASLHVNTTSRKKSPSRMISVNELLTTLHIDVDRIGLASHEYMVCESGVHARLRPTAACSKKRRLAYASEGYRIALRHVPRCMVVVKEEDDKEGSSSSSSSSSLASIVLATANGHTVCGVWQKTADRRRREYALFDSGPGMMRVGLTAEELVEGIGSALRIPRAAWGTTVDITESEPESSESESSCAALPNLLPGTARVPGGTRARTTKKRRRDTTTSTDMESSDGGALDRFYCDVTIFYLLS